MFPLYRRALTATVVTLLAAQALVAQGQSIVVSWSSNRFAMRDTFEFRLAGGLTQRLTYSQQTITFSGIAPGTPYAISQVSGPRPCAFLDPASGKMLRTTIYLTVNCGFPPMTMQYLTVTGLAEGEFVDVTNSDGSGTRAPFNVEKQSNGAYPIGNPMWVRQTSGVRNCLVTPTEYTITAEPTVVTVDCSPANGAVAPAGTQSNSPPPAPAGTPAPAGATPSPTGTGVAGKVAGTVTATPGTRVVLAQGTDSVVVTGRTDGTAQITSTPFTFAKPLASGATYSVSVRRAPAGVRCVVGAASGSAAAPMPVRVVCDRAWDLVSRSADDKVRATFYEAFTPVIGGMGDFDGRYIAYVTNAAGIAGSSGKKRQVIWRDRWTGVTRLISTGPGGVEGNDDSNDPAISADGQSVAFTSRATNLVSGDANGVGDVFVWRAGSSALERVSTAGDGTEANRESQQPALSGDGSVVTFVSSATNLVTTPSGNSSFDVYVKDLRSGAITALSIEEKSGKLMGGARPAISDDGATIAFVSASALRQDDANGLWDIYVWQRGAPQLLRVSRTADGSERRQGDESASREVAPAISGNGAWVSFATTAPNMSGAPTTGQQIYLAEVATNRVIRMSATAAGAAGNGDAPVDQGGRVPMSADGTWVSFMTSAANLGGAVVMKHARTGEVLRLVEPGARVGQAMVSHDGLYTIVGVGASRDPRFPSSGIFVTMR